MKDVVLKGFVDSFAKDRGLERLDPAIIFEAFSVTSLLRKYHHADSTDFEEFLTGGSKDGGIDAIAILVNGHPTKTAEDVDFFIEKLRRLDVEFIFIQAKRSASFEASSIGTFTHGVKSFFDSDSEYKFSEEIEELRRLKDHIYSKSIAMESNPSCSLYYVSSGIWNNDREPKSRIDEAKRYLTKLNIFSSVQVTPIDAERLKTVYRELERGVIKDIDFSKVAVFPKIDGVQEAYIGLLSGDQFINLVSTDDGDLNRNLFYDNVRDFQGHNPVNKDINQTISNAKFRDRFPLLNNGVTIVARSINRTGDSFKISDFQIVNGCQTTHILFQNKKVITDKIFIPVKLVVTSDGETISEVIKATNRQTAVMPEALESLTPFHKELEDYYSAQESKYDKDSRIFYERRSKQYALDRIKPSNIVTLTAQTKSFVAMYLNEPHSHIRYYGELLKSYQSRLFVNGHNPAPYYSSGYTFHAIEQLLNSNQIDRKYKKWKYHIIMILRILIGGYSSPPFNSKKIQSYSINIVDTLREPGNSIKYCNTAIDIINECESAFASPHSRDLTRLKIFTSSLLDHIKDNGKEKNILKTPALGSKGYGTILWYNDYKNFGFIRNDQGVDIFVHKSGLREIPWNQRRPGTKVSYIVIKGNNDDELKADKVQLVI